MLLQLQRDSFEKVERVFVMGLRARDSIIRQKFFALYNAAIECTLFARMRYIIVEQDWEQLAQFFWLKQALVRRAHPDAQNCFTVQQQADLLRRLCVGVPTST
jgi:hypothetical protein